MCCTKLYFVTCISFDETVLYQLKTISNYKSRNFQNLKFSKKMKTVISDETVLSIDTIRSIGCFLFVQNLLNN